jgi:tRNA pseudouridine55 synthase
MTVFGLLNLDKPQGPTSHDIVAAVRRGTRVQKVGHAGTLDPLATGVLVLCLGPAARLSEYVMGSKKTYRARVRFGVATDTHDADGRIIAENPAPVSREAVEEALDAFRGAIEQIPPMHSAIRQGGKRLYDLARAGVEVERAPRRVMVERLELTAWEPPFAALEIVCSAGTYVRSLARDLGQAVQVGAHLAALERAASGIFTVESAVRWPDFQAAMDDGTWQRWLLPPDLALDGTPALHLGETDAQRVVQGGAVAADAARGLARAYDSGGRFIAVLDGRGDRWQPVKVFIP